MTTGMAEERQYTASGGVQRRVKKGGRRSDSYGLPYTMLSRADTDVKWEKGTELFDGRSSLYNPRPKQIFDTPPLTSSSSKPFGGHTPALPGARRDPSTTYKQPQIARSKSDSGLSLPASLLDRMDLGGNKSKGRGGRTETTSDSPIPGARGGLAARMGLVAASREANTRRKTQNRPVERKEQQRPEKSAGIKGAARAAEMARAPPVPLGTLVVVENLVAGTTADDVKAAFSDFGDILDCGVQQMARSSLFKAEVLFKMESEAEIARSTLDGVLADGERLSVTVRKPTAPAQNGRGNREDDGQIAARLGAPTGRTAEQRANALTAPPVEESKMRSDEILRNDPRAYVITEPSNGNRGRPSGPRRPRDGRYGGGGGRRNNAMEID